MSCLPKYKPTLLSLFLLLAGSSILAQKNEILILDSTDHSFQAEPHTKNENVVPTLLSINDNLDEREVVSVIRDESGLLWIIQPQVAHLYDENTIIESHYFDYKNQHIKHAFLFSGNTLVLVGSHRSLGLLHTKDRLSKKVDYHQLPDHHTTFSFSEGTCYSLQTTQNGKYSVRRFNVDNNRQPIWQDVYNFRSTDRINAFSYDEPNKNFIYISESSDLVHIDQKGVSRHSVETIDEGFIKASQIIKHQEGYLLFFSSRQGLYWYQHGKELEIITDQGMYGYHSYDSNNALLLGIRTKPKIINTVIQLTGKQITYREFGFNFDTTTDVLSSNFDKEILLFGGNGVYHLSNSSTHQYGIQQHLADPAKTNFEYGEIITDVQVHNNRMYAVSESSGSLFVKQNCSFDPTNQCTFEPIYENKDLFIHKLSSDTINDILWITAFDQKRHGSLYQFSNSIMTMEWQTDIIIRQVIAYSKDHILLFGFRKVDQNTYGVIYMYNIKTKVKEEIFNKLNYGIWTAAIIDSKILCGTKTSLFTFDVDTRTIHDIDALRTQRVSSIRKYNKHLYICTRSNGIYILDENLDLYKHLDFSQEPISNRVTDIIQDQNQNFWASTFKGIALLSPEHNFLKRVTIKDGLSSWEFNSYATDTLHNSIFFGSLNGMTEIHTPTFYKRADNSVRIYNMKGLYQNDYYTPSKSGITYTYKFTPKMLSFDSYYNNRASPEPNHTKIAILKDDTAMPLEQTNNNIRLSNISRGQYDVYQSNLTGERIKIAEIIIKPNYSQILKYLGLGLFISMLSFFIAQLWISKQKTLLIERNELENRLVNIKLESLRSQLNPHFVFNCLNSIQYYIQMNEKVLARDYLAKFSKLMRYFLESSRNDKLPVSEEINLLTLYLDLEKLRFENKFDYNISSTLNIDYKIPTMILQPHVENSIVHGISHLEDRVGHIDIHFSALENGLECTIIDNGIGREAAQKIKLRKKRNHKSRATQIIEERMTILNNQGNGETTIRYNDKVDNRGNVIGTIAKITFIQNSHVKTKPKLSEQIPHE